PHCCSAQISRARVYSTSLHDALPIWARFHRVDGTDQPIRVNCSPTRLLPPSASTSRGTSTVTRCQSRLPATSVFRPSTVTRRGRDRKSTRLNSSHQILSYAVFCLKKK